MRAFSRALKILWSAGDRFPGFMSSALTRAESGEIVRPVLGDARMEGGSVTGGGVSTAAIFTASVAASAASTRGAGAGAEVE